MRRTEYLKASPPMFRSPLLDRFTRVHPAVPVVLYLPVILVLLVTGIGRVGALTALGLAMGGYAVWTLTEYWLHRVVFHFEPERGLGARLHWMIHGVHHDHPNDPMRLVMPPSASVPLAAAFYAVFWLVLGAHPDEGEVVDGLPVLAGEPRPLEARPPGVPARQAAALAATGFVAGAATVAVVSRRRTRLPRRRRRRKG